VFHDINKKEKTEQEEEEAAAAAQIPSNFGSFFPPSIDDFRLSFK